MKNQLTTLDVLTVATDLINTNGQTSTLEVKNELRNQGYPEYLAHQKNISNLMNELSEEGELDYSFNGTYRVYELPSTPQYNTSRPSQHVSNNGNSITLTNGTTFELIDTPSTDDWIVTNKQLNETIAIDKQHNRDNARCVGRIYWNTDIIHLIASRKK